MINIAIGLTKKETVAKSLVRFFSAKTEEDGYLYIGYPVFGADDGLEQVGALLISPKWGVISFDLRDDHSAQIDYQDGMDNNYNKLEAKFKSNKNLIERKKLKFEIQSVIFNPLWNENVYDPEYPILNETSLEAYLNDKGYVLEESLYKMIVSSVQAISNIRKNTKRTNDLLPDSKGKKLESLENAIAVLDNSQNKGVIETVHGVQRIRGLAGSGKTIVLAAKAAYLHSIEPEWRIAVTFNARSLKGQFNRLITNFSIAQSQNEPNWNFIHIIHAWGAPAKSLYHSQNGIYYIYCKRYGVEYLDFDAAKRMFGADKAFEGACEKALDESKDQEELDGIFDVILVDEAQDLSPAFLRICYKLLKNPKRLVYAYDELQSLNKATMPSPEEIFGKDENGRPVVQFKENNDGEPQQDIILNCCYRNSRPVLVTAHALGFGIYRSPQNGESTGIVQMFDRQNLWRDVGYKCDTEIKDGEKVVLYRDNQSSPAFLENHSNIDDLIQFHSFKTKMEQDNWLVNQIERDIREDLLNANDIIVINPDPFTTKKVVGSIRAGLFEKHINSHLAGVDTSPDVFYLDENSVVFSGIYRAKGNEAGLVYIINAQDCYEDIGNENIAVVRNRLFTAITRSKAWVRVIGYGPNMQKLEYEFNRIKEHQFKLEFVYPTEDQRKVMNIVNRDMTNAERKAIKDKKKSLAEIISSLESGNLRREDLGEDTITKLKNLLDER